MIEIENAEKFIAHYRKVYGKQIVRIPYTTKAGERKTLLMCKCYKRWISLPYMSVGVLENRVTDRKTAPFKLFESEDDNIISTGKQAWEIRDTIAHSQYIYSEKIVPVMEIGGVENIWEKFDSDIKRKIRRAFKNGIEVVIGTSKKHVNLFYKAYSRRMREIGVPACGKSLIERKVKSGETTIFVALKDKEIIGGATLNNFSEGVLENEYFATIAEANKFYTSYILHYAMICYAKEHGARLYSFGRSSRNTSVHNYKRHWKAPEYNLYWSYSKRVSNIRQKKKYYKLWRKLPYRVTSCFGPLLSKYIY